MEHQEIAEKLLYPLWRGIADGYKSKYARNIWEQFQNQIKSAAYTSKLSTFFDVLCRRLDIRLRKDGTQTVQTVLTSGQDRAILKTLRDETALLVLLVRVMNEERRDAIEAEQPVARTGEELF